MQKLVRIYINHKLLLHKYCLVVYTQILFSAENCAVSQHLLRIQKLPVTHSYTNSTYVFGVENCAASY